MFFSKKGFCILILLLATLSPFMVRAEDKTVQAPRGGIGVRVLYERGEEEKGYFYFNLKPGESKKKKMEITNYSPETMKISVFAADAWNNENGSLVGTLYDDKDKINDVGKWIKVDKPLLDIKPEYTEEVTIDFTVPPDATPGDHIGFVFVQPIGKASPDRKAQENQAAMSIKIVQRIGIVVWERTDGDLTKLLEINNLNKEINKGMLFLSVDLENKGNTFLKPEVSWELFDSQGKKFMDGPAQPIGYSLPSGKNVVSIPIASRRPVPKGEYLLKFKITDDKGFSNNKDFKVELP